VREGAAAALVGSKGSSYVGRGRIPKYKKFDESADKDDDRELSKEEALGKGKPGAFSVMV
jgi:hypothetical protein